MDAPVSLLVIDGSPMNNWYKLFKSEKNVKVEQTSWDLIDVFCDTAKCVVDIKPSPGNRQQIAKTRSDLWHIAKARKDNRAIYGSCKKFCSRNSWYFCLGCLTTGKSYVNQLLGLQIGNIPSVNSLDSIFKSTQRVSFEIVV